VLQGDNAPQLRNRWRPARDARATRGHDPAPRSRPRRLAPSPATRSRPVTTVAVAPGCWHRGQSVPARTQCPGGPLLPWASPLAGLWTTRPLPQAMRASRAIACARGSHTTHRPPATASGRPSAPGLARREQPDCCGLTQPPRPVRAAGLQRLAGADAFPGPGGFEFRLFMRTRIPVGGSAPSVRSALLKRPSNRHA
jgi:hypothetical protein